MTSERIQSKFQKLLYDLSEDHFNALNEEFRIKYAENLEPFNEEQMTVFRQFIMEVVEEELAVIRLNYIL